MNLQTKYVIWNCVNKIVKINKKKKSKQIIDFNDKTRIVAVNLFFKRILILSNTIDLNTILWIYSKQ